MKRRSIDREYFTDMHCLSILSDKSRRVFGFSSSSIRFSIEQFGVFFSEVKFERFLNKDGTRRNELWNEDRPIDYGLIQRRFLCEFFKSESEHQ